MANPPTNNRLDPKLKQKVLQRAKKEGLDLSTVVRFLLLAYAEGRAAITITEPMPEYPPEVIDMILKETENMRKLHRAGKLKGYASGKELIRDTLGK